MSLFPSRNNKTSPKGGLLVKERTGSESNEFFSL